MGSLIPTSSYFGDQPVILEGHSHPINSIAFSSSYQLIASGSGDKSIRFWNATSGEYITTLNGHSDSIWSIAFSPDSTKLASGSADKTVKLWNVGSRVQTASLEGHSNTVCSVAFSSDGSNLVSGSADKTIRLWEVKSSTIISILEGHSSWVRSVAFSPDDKILASGSDDYTIRIWNVESRTSIATLNGHQRWTTSVVFSPSGEYLASGSGDRTVQLWNVAARTHIATMKGHTQPVRSVAFSPNGKYLASGSWDYTIQLWDVASRSHISTLKGHSRDVECVTFSPDGARLASGSRDSTIRIWKVSAEEATNMQGATFTSDSVGLTYNTTNSQQDPPDPASTSVQLSNDITEFVTLQNTTIIAYGGFGELFIGVHKDRGKVALKKPRRLLDEALIRRFLREVDLWCSVSHQYILPCLGMCRVGPDIYVVSPFIENGDLLSCMSSGKDLNRSKLLYEVAEALAHLHHRGIVHGDVKAQNILLADDESALLCDFGLAKAFDTMATSSEVKGAGSVRWMAPELFLGKSRSMASDVYSLGITIAEVLSGHAPYQDLTEAFAVMFHVVNFDGRPLKEPLSSPEGKSYGTLWNTAEKCWVKEVNDRPYMAQVLAMLFPLTRERA